MADSNHNAPTRLESTFDAIRRDIISGELEPSSRLGIERLRQHYGAGSSTIREALTLLLADALVTAEGQRGFTVSPISVADLRDLSRMRILLEAEALQDSIEHGDDDWEADIVATHHRLTKAQERVDTGQTDATHDWEIRNREFHNALIARCDSKWIRYMLDLLTRHSERYRRISLADSSIPREVGEEHMALMEAVLNRDVELAHKIAADHVQRTVDVLAALYEQRSRAEA